MAAFSQRHGGAAALPRPAGALADPLPALIGAAAAAAAIAVSAGAVTLLVRRLAGGFQTLPGPATSWLVTAAGIAVIAAADAAIRWGAVSRWTALLPRAGLVLGLFALVAGGESGAAGGASLAAVALAAIVAVVPPPRPGFQRRAWPRPETAPRRPLPPSRPGPWAEELPAPAAGVTVPEAFAQLLNDAPAAGLRQRLERFETAAGEDHLVGRVIVSLSPGSRSGHAHLGFCPPFAALPLVAVTTDYDGVEALVSAAEVVPWGVRVECRLSEPAEEPLEIPVDVVAHLTRPAD